MLTLEEQCHSVTNRYRLSDQYLILPHYAWAKDPLQVSEGPAGFNVTKYQKFNDKISVSTLQLTSGKLPLFEFWCNIKEVYPHLSEKAIRVCFPFLTTYFVRLHSPHIL